MKEKSTPKNKPKLPICRDTPKLKVKRKNNAPDRRQARTHEYTVAKDWFTSKKVMKVEDDGTVLVGEQKIDDFGFTTIATFLRLVGYQVPRKLRKKDLVDGLKAWILK